MSLDAPLKNKMIQTPIAKKGFHFASDGLHFAEFIEADTIEEATATYHKIKRLLFPTGDTTVAPPISSTSASSKERGGDAVQ